MSDDQWGDYVDWYRDGPAGTNIDNHIRTCTRQYLGDLDAFLSDDDPDEPDEPIVVYGVAHTAYVEDGDPRPFIIDLTFYPAEDRDPIEDAHQLAEGVISSIESHLQRQEQRRT